MGRGLVASGEAEEVVENGHAVIRALFGQGNQERLHLTNKLPAVIKINSFD